MSRGRIHNINLAAPPQVLTVAPGDTVRVTTEFDYIGPALSARMISAIWHSTLFDPHDEIVRGNKSFSIPSSLPPGNHIGVTMDLLVPSGEIGTDYGLYSSIRDVPGPDIYMDPKYLENIITIVEVVPEFKGTISKKELEYNESRGTIPVSNVPQDKRGLVHVVGRNNMTIPQEMGCTWRVTDPNGVVVEEHTDDWAGWPGPTDVDPGKTHEFISRSRFDLNKAGTWSISIWLWMNSASPVMVASYSGVLCTVGAPPATYHLSIFVPTWAYGGYVTPSSGDYPANTTVKLTAHPFSGYQFLSWGVDASGTSPIYNLPMNSDKNVEAYFKKVAIKQCPLSVSASPSSGGSVTRSPDKSLYDDGEMIDVTAIANPGWSFDKFTGVRFDGSSWETRVNPVRVRGCRTTSVTAHFI